MPKYVDGFLLPLPKKNVAAYRKMARLGGKVWRERDRVNAAVMKDPRMAKMGPPMTMPFDIERMVYGGFEVLVDM
jgi:uncharacterized protein YbaA (DUF1428 family)